MDGSGPIADAEALYGAVFGTIEPDLHRLVEQDAVADEIGRGRGKKRNDHGVSVVALCESVDFPVFPDNSEARGCALLEVELDPRGVRVLLEGRGSQDLVAAVRAIGGFHCAYPASQKRLEDAEALFFRQPFT